jgi:hypothetical protein
VNEMLPDSPGIYVIINKVNGRRGVGLSTRSIKARVRQHLQALRTVVDHPTPMQRDAMKLGIESFRFETLEICSPRDGLNLRRHLQAREGWWAEHLGTLDEHKGYNREAGGRRSPASLVRERERRLIDCFPARYQLLPDVTLDQPIGTCLLQGSSLPGIGALQVHQNGHQGFSVDQASPDAPSANMSA